MHLDPSVAFWVVFNLAALVVSVFNLRDARQDEQARVEEGADGQIAIVTRFTIVSEYVWLVPILAGLVAGIFTIFPPILSDRPLRNLLILVLVESLPLFILTQSLLRWRHRRALINYPSRDAMKDTLSRIQSETESGTPTDK